MELACLDLEGVLIPEIWIALRKPRHREKAVWGLREAAGVDRPREAGGDQVRQVARAGEDAVMLSRGHHEDARPNPLP